MTELLKKTLVRRGCPAKVLSSKRVWLLTPSEFEEAFDPKWPQPGLESWTCTPRVLRPDFGILSLAHYRALCEDGDIRGA